MCNTHTWAVLQILDTVLRIPDTSTLEHTSRRGTHTPIHGSIELVRVLRVARALDWSGILAWAGALGRPGVWEVAVGLPWARSRRGRRNFDNFRIQHGGPSRIHGGGGIHGRSASRGSGSHRVFLMWSGGHLAAGRMGRSLICVARRVEHCLLTVERCVRCLGC